jgi:uncharacterized protein
MRSPFTLVCRDRRGREVRLRYDPHTSALTDEAGVPVVPEEPGGRFEPAPRVSPESPGRKSSAPQTLKIQLGLKCNYTCSYCNQASEIGSATVTKTADADEFLAGLDGWLTAAPERIEFWGGEPFVYFAKLKRLVPALRERFPAAEMSVVTNGSLLDAEILDFIERYDLLVAVSHDGPGQSLRGPDPFDDPERAVWLRELWRRRGRAKRMSFNVVLTAANCDVEATHRWFAKKLGDREVVLFTEGAVSTYDAQAAQGAGVFTAEKYAVLHRSLVKAFGKREGGGYVQVQEKAKDFLDSLYARRPSSALGQKCGMDRADQLAVDLSGAVMTCQNTGAQGRHGIGNVADLAGARLDTSWHWSTRECCNHCPVLQLCKGACMFLEGDLFAQSCENEFHYNRAILAAVLREVAGLELERIEGDIRRPAIRKRIPIAVAATQ